MVTQLGLDDVVELTITSATVGAEKPNPAIFNHAISVPGASPAHSWMIGDNPIADVQGARQAGLSAVLADGAYSDAIGVTIFRLPSTSPQ
ncbi:HAD family hydrolase [Microlunatus sp. Gsoil 973]|uniref:HAD family hydrolase n=1 Tax=Microlunatus sp. Gsoil 973 TaxID=2672569 RepID=UPI00351B2304